MIARTSKSWMGLTLSRLCLYVLIVVALILGVFLYAHRMTAQMRTDRGLLYAYAVTVAHMVSSREAESLSVESLVEAANSMNAEKNRNLIHANTESPDARRVIGLACIPAGQNHISWAAVIAAHRDGETCYLIDVQGRIQNASGIQADAAMESGPAGAFWHRVSLERGKAPHQDD